MPLGEIRSEVDTVRAVFDQVAGSYLAESQEVKTAATALADAGDGSNRTELPEAVGSAHAAIQEAEQAATAIAEAGRLCSSYVWQL